MKVLVTGASGLIGGRLLAALARDETTFVRAASRVARNWPTGVDGVVAHSDAPETLIAACKGMEVVVNLASMPEAACAIDPEAALRANAGGTLALVRAAMAADVARFVQLSTSKVYGNNPSGMVTEETITHPTSHYAITHRAAEDYASLHPDAIVLRLANGFGAPADLATPCWGIMVNEFGRQLVTTRRIVIRSDGLAWRNFIPLDDVIVALRAAATILPMGTYNLGAAESMTIRAMADRVAAVGEGVLGFRAEIVVGASVLNAPIEPLDYRTDRFRSTGVSLIESIDHEIGRTLLAARAAFAGISDV